MDIELLLRLGTREDLIRIADNLVTQLLPDTGVAYTKKPFDTMKKAAKLKSIIFASPDRFKLFEDVLLLYLGMFIQTFYDLAVIRVNSKKLLQSENIDREHRLLHQVLIALIQSYVVVSGICSVFIDSVRMLSNTWTNFTEWPGGRRPLNTTWPWDVKPALMVLWGVCWMFYGSPVFQEGNWEQVGLEDEIHSYHNGAVNELGNGEYSNILFGSSIGFNSFDPLLEGNLWLFPDTVPGTPTLSLSIVQPEPKDLWPQADLVADNGLYNEALSTATVARPSLYSPPAIFAGPDFLNTLESSRATNIDPGPSSFQIRRLDGSSFSQEGMTNREAISTAKGPVYTNTRRQSQTHISSVVPAVSHNASEAPRNSSNEYYCAHQACKSTKPAFLRKCEWSKHMDKHTRPYICHARGCEELQGFTSKGDLDRHGREVHQPDARASLKCPYADCNRHSGFSRKSNLEDHIKRRHKDSAPIAKRDGLSMGSKADRLAQSLPAAPSPEIDAPADEDNGVSGRRGIDSDEAVDVGRQKRRRIERSSSIVETAAPNARSSEGIAGENGVMTNEGALQAENQRLKRILEFRDAELEEKDAQIRKLRSMVDNALCGRSLRS